MVKKDPEARNNTEKAKKNNSIFYWLILFIILLNIGAIFAAVKIVEMRGLSDSAEVKVIVHTLKEYDNRLNRMEELPVNIAENTQQISSVARTLNLLSENFKALDDEVGHNKFQKLQQQIDESHHRIDALDERQNEESLVLSAALLIKENALYHRNFQTEAGVLTSLSQNMPAIKEDVIVIDKYKKAYLFDSVELVREYEALMQNFSFNNPKSDENAEGAIAKSIKLVKDTVAGMHFDKMIVLKKERKTDKQKQLLAGLGKLVKSHNFKEALDFIANNSEFAEVKDERFDNWKTIVASKIEFDTALSHLISSMLKAIRIDFDKYSKNSLKIDDSGSLQNESASKEENSDD